MQDFESALVAIPPHFDDILHKRPFAVDEVTYTTDTPGYYTVRGGELTAELPPSLDHVILRIGGIEKLLQFR